MQIIKKTNIRFLLADEGKHIRDIIDVYIPEHINEETGELISEHVPYYAEIIFLAEQIKDEEIYDLYVEEPIEEEVLEDNE